MLIKLIKNGLEIKGDPILLKLQSEAPEPIFAYDKCIGADGEYITQAEFEKEANRLVEIAKEILVEKSVDIFDYLNLTKTGKFNKAKNILIARSNVRFICKEYYYSDVTLELRLISGEGVYSSKMGYINDGTKAHFEIRFYNTNDDVPIFNECNIPSKPEIKRNVYLKNLIPGHIYEDIKGKKYLYLGRYCLESCYNNTIYSTDEEYLSKVCEHSDSSLDYYYLKMTKKAEKLLTKVSNIEELMHKAPELFDCSMWEYECFKQLSNPLKFVTDCGELLDSTFNKRLVTGTYNGDPFQCYFNDIER